MTSLTVRNATGEDSSLLETLAAECPPLDVHTPYTYWVLSNLFGDGCFIVSDSDRPIGFVTAISNGDRVLLWQIGVLDAHRRQGVSGLLIDAVVEWALARGLSTIEMSIDPENVASQASFRSYARKRGWRFEAAGDVDLRSARDAQFREFERLYALRLGSA